MFLFYFIFATQGVFELSHPLQTPTQTTHTMAINTVLHFPVSDQLLFYVEDNKTKQSKQNKNIAPYFQCELLNLQTSRSETRKQAHNRNHYHTFHVSFLMGHNDPPKLSYMPVDWLTWSIHGVLSSVVSFYIGQTLGKVRDKDSRACRSLPWFSPRGCTVSHRGEF